MGCKVDTLVDRYGVTVPSEGHDSVDEYLVTRWTGADGRSADGYKALTEWFNKRLLRQIYEESGRDTMGHHVDREYELITDGEDVARDELAADLATHGLDVDEIERDLISWSTMRHHLKGCLEAEKEIASASTDWESNSVELAREQTAEKARSVLSSLGSKDRLQDAENAEVDVEVKLGCPECSVRVPFEHAVERGYVCETHTETDSEESVRERVQNGLSSAVISYGFVEAFQVLAAEEAFLVESVLAAGL